MSGNIDTYLLSQLKWCGGGGGGVVVVGVGGGKYHTLIQVKFIHVNKFCTDTDIIKYETKHQHEYQNNNSLIFILQKVWMMFFKD